MHKIEQNCTSIPSVLPENFDSFEEYCVEQAISNLVYAYVSFDCEMVVRYAVALKTDIDARKARNYFNSSYGNWKYCPDVPEVCLLRRG